MVAQSGELSEVVGDGEADLALEELGHRGDGAGRLVESDALDAVHGEKEGGKGDAVAFGIEDAVDEIVEGVEIDGAGGDARGMNGEKLAPEAFLGAVEAEDDDGVGFHANLESKTE
jgi:hypothetical protein